MKVQRRQLKIAAFYCDCSKFSESLIGRITMESEALLHQSFAQLKCV